MNLPAHQLQDAPVCPILNITFSTTPTASFATATTDGWVAYSCNPLAVVTRRDIPNASLRLVLPLASSNILFLVGGPPSPLYSPNKVIVWDDKLARVVSQLEFREEVRNLAARRDRLIVVLRRRVIVFVLSAGPNGIWREGVYETCDNSLGVVALATSEGSTLLALPGRQAGQVQLAHLPPLGSSHVTLPPPPSHDPSSVPYPAKSIIVAHTSTLSALAISPDGKRLATASEKGTLIRVWDVASSHLIKELRRGTDSAIIHNISFRNDGDAICVSSDKGTVHAWDLTVTKEEKRRSDSGGEDSPRQKQFNALKPYLPKYFSSEWSHSQFRLPSSTPAPSRLPRFSLSGDTIPGQNTSSIDDDVCICTWIEVPKEGPAGATQPKPSKKGKERETDVPLPDASPNPGSSNAAAHSSSRPTPDRQRSNATAKAFHPPAPPPPPEMESQILALTRSGGWFRISLKKPQSSTASHSNPRLVTTQSNEHQRPSFGLAKESTNDCTLEEYRRFGTTDGW